MADDHLQRAIDNHERALSAHARAAVVHKQAADTQEAHAAFERKLGNGASATKMEARADVARERAHQQARHADAEREKIDTLRVQLELREQLSRRS